MATKRKKKAEPVDKQERVKQVYALIANAGKLMAKETALGEIAMYQDKIKRWRQELKVLQGR